MEECSKNTCCHTEKKSCHTEDGCEKFLLELADEAWSEVLKDKIKEHILSTQGDRMTELAKIVAEGNNLRWKHKIEKKQGCMDFKEKLCRFFSQKK